VRLIVRSASAASVVARCMLAAYAAHALEGANETTRQGVAGRFGEERHTAVLTVWLERRAADLGRTSGKGLATVRSP